MEDVNYQRGWVDVDNIANEIEERTDFDEKIDTATQQAAAMAELARARADDIPAFAGFRDAADLTTLLANSTWRYDATGAAQVVAGDVFRTRKEGFSYVAAASGAIDHAITTVGGVKLYVSTGPDGSVRVEQFGAVGTTDGTEVDSNAAFWAFKAWAVARGKAVLHCASGHRYCYTNPRWPMNIPNLRIVGNGCEFRNIHAAGLDVDTSPLITAAGLDKNLATEGATWAQGDSYLIASAAIGATSIITQTPADAGNFSVGEWIMLTSVNVFPANPPAYRNVDFVKVNTVNSATGVIGIDRPLQNPHSADLPSNSALQHAGRVRKIEQASKWGIRHRYEGITFSRKNGTDIASYPYLQGEDITLVDCISQNISAANARSIKIENCETLLGFELDKNVNNVHVLGGVHRGLSQCTSIDVLTLERTKILSTVSAVVPRRLVIIDSDVIGANGFQLAIKRVETVDLRGGRVSNMWPFSAAGSFNVQRGTAEPVVTVGSDGVTLTSNAYLRVPLPTSGNSGQYYRFDWFAHATVGQIVREVVVSNGHHVCTGTWGIITALRQHDADTAEIDVMFNGTVGGTARLALSRIPNITARDVIFGTNQNPISFGPDVALGQRFVRRRAVISTASPFGAPIFVEGRPKSISVNVIKACASACTLQFVADYPASQTLGTVDLATAGLRQRTRDSFSGNIGLDSGFGAVISRTASHISRMYANFNGSGLGLSAIEWAVVDVEIELEMGGNVY